MKPFEFVLIIISVIIGLALTEFAIGVSFMIQNYEAAHFYWPHFVLMLTGLIGCLNYWATVYKLRKVQIWSVVEIGIVFLTGLIYFVLTKIYFPTSDRFDLDYEKYFHDNYKKIFILMVCFVMSYSFEALLIRKVRQLKKFTVQIAFIIILLSGIIADNKLYTSVLAVLLFLLQFFYMYKTRIIVTES